jgi:hypothetical protein
MTRSRSCSFGPSMRCVQRASMMVCVKCTITPTRHVRHLRPWVASEQSTQHTFGRQNWSPIPLCASLEGGRGATDVLACFYCSVPQAPSSRLCVLARGAYSSLGFFSGFLGRGGLAICFAVPLTIIPRAALFRSCSFVCFGHVG